jgi:inner membrane protein YidH
MDSPAAAAHQVGLRDYLAAERTFLAWIRTGLALMGFGFVVARFGLFLQQLRIFQPAAPAAPAASGGLSLWFGTALIAVGVVVNLSAAWRHTRLIRDLDSGRLPRCTTLTQNVAIALLLALVGLAMAIYLVSFRSSSNVHSRNMVTGTRFRYPTGPTPLFSTNCPPIPEDIAPGPGAKSEHFESAFRRVTVERFLGEIAPLPESKGKHHAAARPRHTCDGMFG